jgi:hypothetical protein
MIPRDPPERLSITAERVDDYATRRYLCTITLTVPADTATEAIALLADAVAGIS